MIIDSHCHLTYEPMSLSLNDTIKRANNDGIKYILTISTEDKSFDKILKIIKNIKVFMELMVFILMKQNYIKILKKNDILKKLI